MFQCFSGLYSALFDKSSGKKGQISSIDLLASPQAKKSCMFEFPAFLPPTNLRLLMHSPSALT